MRPFQDSGHVAVSKINVASMYCIQSMAVLREDTVFSYLFVRMLLLPLSQSAAGVVRSSLFLLVSSGTSR